MSVHVIPEFISKKEIEALYKYTSTGRQQAWGFSGDTVGSSHDHRKVPGFTCDMTENLHVYKSWKRPLNPGLVDPCLQMICNITNSFESRGSPVGITELHRFRFNYLFNSRVEGWHEPHIDDHDLCVAGDDHWVCVIQMIGDGPTYVFDREWGHDEEFTSADPYKLVEFVPGNAVIFPGNRYHSSSSPVESQFRLAININLG